MRGITVDRVTAEQYWEVMRREPPSDVSQAEADDLEFLFGHLWNGPALTRRERRLITITCAAYATTPEPIQDQVYGALTSSDLSIEELLEVVLHFAVYCGWPKASNLEMYIRMGWAQVQQERGEDPKPLPPRTNDELGLNDWEARLQRGEQEFRNVNLIDAPPRDTPYQHSGILNYVFGHVWQRPGLGRRDRRFVTVASVGLCEAPIPIASHVASALRSGDLSKEEMNELVKQFDAYSAPGLADALRDAADKTWSEVSASK